MLRRQANVVGLGLIGGSIALKLGRIGFQVWGSDENREVEKEALERGIIDSVGINEHAEMSFVATPVSSLFEAVTTVLGKTSGIVTDVGGVKTPIVSTINDPRFVGGHPMAGSELTGLDGADASLFEGAVWVLTPTQTSADKAFETLATVIRELGADVVVLDAKRHDRLVAVTSHLPHLTAATLMGLAQATAEEHVAVFRLAAGGFRDMTRVASSQSKIWLDICKENRVAIVEALDGMINGLNEMRTIVVSNDEAMLRERLQNARIARSNLPRRVQELQDVCEVRVPIPDRSGAAADVFILAADLGVNIANFEVTHSVEGQRGVLILIIDRESAEMFRGGLMARGFKATVVQNP